jgi:hypothetical protein
MNARRAKKRTEQAYVRDAYIRLRKKGVPSIWEAPIMGRSADLVYLEENDLITIEFKLTDWRKGLRQARDHQIGSDFAYLCVPNREPSEALRVAANESGIGLLRFIEGLDWPFEIILPALRSTLTWSVIRDQLFGRLKTPSNQRYATA